MVFVVNKTRIPGVLRTCLAGLCLSLGVFISATSTSSNSTPVWSYKVVSTYPHDESAFTQGLVFADGVLYEGTGGFGKSTLRKVGLESGAILKLYKLPQEFFGEGITVYQDHIVQLTWRSHKGFVYNKDSFQMVRGFSYDTDGWGLTHDGKHLIMSDGTATLYFLDPSTFGTIRQVHVFDNTGPVSLLNELEYVGGTIYANVWRTDRIAVIDPQTGRVIKWIDLQGINGPTDTAQTEACLNGIAYDPAGHRLFVTGKLWPKLFEITLVPPE